MAQLNFFISMLLYYSLNQVASKEYYITANSLTTNLCPTPCLTLTQFVTNSRHLLNPDVILVFSPGIHSLHGILKVSNLSTFSMISDSKNATAQIRCASYAQMIFNWSQTILITNLEFVGCGGNQVMNVDEFMVRNSSFTGKEFSGIAIELIETTAKIVNCTFSSNRNGRYIFNSYDRSSYRYRRQAGGAITATQTNLNISQSVFENNGAHDLDYGGAIYAEQQSIINIKASTFIGNTARLGIFYSHSCSINIETSEFSNNNVTVTYDDGVLTSYSSNITIQGGVFENNLGCILHFDGSIVSINSSKFHNNSVDYYGVVKLSGYSNARIEKSLFEGNNGTAISSDSSTITIKISEFYDNFAIEAAILSTADSNVTIQEITFYNNNGGIYLTGGNNIIDTSKFKYNPGTVIFPFYGKVIISTCEFDSNTKFFGYSVAILRSMRSTMTIIDSNFTNNEVQILQSMTSTIEYHNSLLIVNNSVDLNLGSGYSIIHLANSEFIGHPSGNAIISNNIRSLVAVTSNVTFMGSVRFLNNQLSQTTSYSYMQVGGAVTLIQSNAYFYGSCSFENNHAENGGAILSTDSKLYVTGNVTVAHNTANRNGGGVYLMDSDLNCLNVSIFMLLHNTAAHKGGGIHAISSSIKATSLLKIPQVDTATLYLANNTAQKGGGLSLEANAKLHVLKYYSEGIDKESFTYLQANTVIFTANSADYGGAVYVDDDTNSGTCSGDPKIDCFFQVFLYMYLFIEGLYDQKSLPQGFFNFTQENLKPQSLYFSENNASISGSTLFGGLLDRCAVNQFAEVRITYAGDIENGANGIIYLKQVSTITDMSISSEPLKVCLCIDNKHNCTHQRRIEVKKGETFTVSLTSLDQINHPVNGLIHASLYLAGSAVASGQATREIPAKCTNLTFNVVSPHSSEQLTLYALDGPCGNVNLSKISLELRYTFSSLQLSNWFANCRNK